MNRILIAEDEPRIASFLEKGLRAKGYTATITTNGLNTLSMASEDNFDLLLLDLGLPDQDGLTVLEELRRQGATFPIIIMTARHSIQDKLTGLKKGANDYITKPFSFADLIARIRQQIPNAGQARIKNNKID